MMENEIYSVTEEVTETAVANSGLKKAGIVGLGIALTGGLFLLGRKIYKVYKAKKAAEDDIVADCGEDEYFED